MTLLRVARIALWSAAIVLPGCGGGGGGAGTGQANNAPRTFTVGGTVSGLTGSGLVLQNNAGSDLTIAGNGSFTFPAQQDGSAYSISIRSNPTNPAQNCTVTDGTGVLAGSSVGAVRIVCATATYSVGGSVSGLTGSGLTLRLNGGPALAIGQNGAFAFTDPVPSGASYVVTIGASPINPSETCSVGNATGSVSNAPVTNLQVTCSTNAYLIRGTVTGLAGSGLVLHNNGSDALTISGDGSFVFPLPIPSGGTYSVTTATQPSGTRQSCSVAAGAGAVIDADVASVVVTCENRYTVGGAVVGTLSAGLVVRLNATTDLAVPADGSFVFSDTLPTNASYGVTVVSEPSGQDCSVTQGNGTTASADIANVQVRCSFPATIAYGVKKLTFAWDGVSGATSYRLLHDPDGSSGFTTLQTLPAHARSAGVDVAVYRHDWAQARYRVEVCTSQACMDSNELTTHDGMLQTIGYFKASNARLSAMFSVVALSGDGNTLAVGASSEYSAATGINGDQTDASLQGAGAVYVFRRGTAGWTQEAYVKASNTHSDARFGSAVSLSFDGSTLAVGSFRERGGSRGINGDDSLLNTPIAGAAYVFVRNGSTWSQQAYIKASNSDMGDYFGDSVSLSADGNTLAVGATREASASSGVNGDETDNSAGDSGAVYVFERSAGTWAQHAYLKPLFNSSTLALSSVWFGSSVQLSGDGSTLAIGAPGESGASTGINGNPQNLSARFGTGAVYVFARQAGSWAQQAYVKASNTGDEDFFGGSVALAHDGNVLAVGASGEDSSATGANGDQTNNVAQNSGAVYVFRRTSGVWAQQSYLKASNTQTDDLYGVSLALSGDGTVVAVGAVMEDSSRRGVTTELFDEGADSAGAVYLHELRGGAWQGPVYIKAPNPDGGHVWYGNPFPYRGDRYGTSVSLSSDAGSLAVGAPGEQSVATGIGGDQSDNRSSGVGAVYLY